ncbi:hypothetical protein LSAT2_017371 [Lamellibrachia satsuma]|nr:hypothetical protein LSAT2_017371 [Lamellibrachia satsuma]
MRDTADPDKRYPQERVIVDSRSQVETVNHIRDTCVHRQRRFYCNIVTMAGMCAPEHYGIYKYSRFYGASGYPTGVTPSRHPSGSCQTDGMRPRSSMMLLQDHVASTGYGLRPNAALPSHQRSGQGSYQLIDFPESGTQVVGRTVHPMFVIHPEWKSEKLQQQADRRKWDEKFNYYYV